MILNFGDSFELEGEGGLEAMLDVGCWVLGVGCWVLGVGCWVLDVGCWMLDVGCWGSEGRGWTFLTQSRRGRGVNAEDGPGCFEFLRVGRWMSTGSAARSPMRYRLFW